MRIVTALVVGFANLFMLTACLPEKMPTYAPDGKHITLVTKDPSTKIGTLWLCDLPERTTVPHHAPGSWTLESASWFEDQLWVLCSRHEGVLTDKETGRPFIDKETGKPARDIQMMWAPFDLATDRIAELDLQFRRLEFHFESPYLAGYEGRPMLFIATEESLGNGSFRYLLLNPRKLNERSKVKLPRMLPAGQAWSVRFVEQDPYKGQGTFEGLKAELVAAEINDDKGQKKCVIPAATLSEIHGFSKPPFPTHVRVSSDKAVIALVHEKETVERHPQRFTFGVFEIETGKLLWFGKGGSLRGTPLVTRKAVWTLEYIGPHGYIPHQGPGAGGPDDDLPADSFTLVRYTPPDKAQSPAVRTEIATYNLGKGNTVRSFAPGPKDDVFLVAVEGSNPRLLVVPIREPLKQADVVSLELRAPQPASKPAKSQ